MFRRYFYKRDELIFDVGVTLFEQKRGLQNLNSEEEDFLLVICYFKVAIR